MVFPPPSRPQRPRLVTWRRCLSHDEISVAFRRGLVNSGAAVAAEIRRLRAKKTAPGACAPGAVRESNLLCSFGRRVFYGFLRILRSNIMTSSDAVELIPIPKRLIAFFPNTLE